MSTKPLNLTAIAAALGIIGEQFAVLEGAFRASAGGGSDGASDGKAGRKPAGKSSPKVEAGADDDMAEVTEDDVREALKALAATKGKETMVEALASVGAGKLGDVDESQYAELMEKVKELTEAEDEAPAKKAPAKKAPAKKAKAGPTLDEVTEAAKALIEADKAAYVKITKKLGKPSEADEADYQALIDAYTEAMPDDGGDDDLL